jgi:alpha-aminoadipate/glutamate carrier protein LysW
MDKEERERMKQAKVDQKLKMGCLYRISMVTKDCPECCKVILLPVDSSQGEVVSCSDCGESYELDEHLDLKHAEVQGEDWGE